jgi:hypothetical protein
MTSIPSYCQLFGSYVFFSGSKPEKSPSRSSVSLNSGSIRTAAFVYLLTYSSNQRAFSMM